MSLLPGCGGSSVDPQWRILRSEPGWIVDHGSFLGPNRVRDLGSYGNGQTDHKDSRFGAKMQGPDDGFWPTAIVVARARCRRGQIMPPGCYIAGGRHASRPSEIYSGLTLCGLPRALGLPQLLKNPSSGDGVLQAEAMPADGDHILGLGIDLGQPLSEPARQGIDGLFRNALPLVLGPDRLDDGITAVYPARLLV